jgi:hypothetical protein
MLSQRMTYTQERLKALRNFWNVTQCSLIEVTDVSEEYTTSILRIEQ